MTATLLAFQKLLFVLFLPLWLAVMVAMVKARKTKFGERSARWNWIFGAVPAYIALNLAVFALVSARVDGYVARSFSGTEKIFVRRGEVLVGLASVDDRRNFQHLLFDSESVGAHHTHPVEPVMVTLEPQQDVFALGRDSKNPDEYWLELVHSEEFGEIREHVRQFRSPELTAFLTARGLR